MASDEGQGTHTANSSDSSKGAVALLPEPFKVNAEAVDRAAAAARAALRRTFSAPVRFPRPLPPPPIHEDPFLSAVEPLLKLS
mgnify:CR=1 FL=1